MLKANEFFGGACYHNRKTREWVATTLLYKSIQMFYGTNTIKYCDTLYQLFASEKDILKLHKNGTCLLKKIENPLLDSIAIATSFENYFKAIFLLRGFVIHEIIRDKNKDLFKEQKKHPILITRLKKLEGLSYKKNNNYSFSLLDYKTISFDRMLKETQYKNKLNITRDVLLALKRIKKFRNSLHFIVGTNEIWNASILFDYKQFLQFANSNIIDTYNQLVKRLTFFSYCEYNKENHDIRFMKEMPNTML